MGQRKHRNAHVVQQGEARARGSEEAVQREGIPRPAVVEGLAASRGQVHEADDAGTPQRVETDHEHRLAAHTQAGVERRDN